MLTAYKFCSLGFGYVLSSRVLVFNTDSDIFRWLFLPMICFGHLYLRLAGNVAFGLKGVFVFREIAILIVLLRPTICGIASPPACIKVSKIAN